MSRILLFKGFDGTLSTENEIGTRFGKVEVFKFEIHLLGIPTLEASQIPLELSVHLNGGLAHEVQHTLMWSVLAPAPLSISSEANAPPKPVKGSRPTKNQRRSSRGDGCG